MRLDAKQIARTIAAWIVTFALTFLAWYVMNYTDYTQLAFFIVVFGVIPIGAYACWQTVPSK